MTDAPTPRSLLLGLFLVAAFSSCGDPDAGTARRPEASVKTLEDGRQRLAIDAESLEAALNDRELPAPERPLGTLELGRGRAFVAAFGDGESSEEFGRLGRFFHVLERPRTADAAYARAGSMAPSEPRWWHYRGDLAEKAGDLPRARIHFQEAARRAPLDFAPRLRLARLERDAGRNEALDRALAELLLRDADSIYGRTERGARHLARGELEAARRDLERARRFAPQYRRIHVLIADLERAAGRPAAAAASIERARDGVAMGLLSLDPWMAELERETTSLLYLQALAEEHWKARRWTALRPVLEELEGREPSPDQCARLAQTLLYLGDHETALATANELIEGDAQDARGYEVRARVRLSRGDLADAEEDIEAALVRNPASLMARESRVRLLLVAERLLEAEVAARELQGLRPSEIGPGLIILETLRAQHDAAAKIGDRNEAARLGGLMQSEFDGLSARHPGAPGLESVRSWLESKRKR